MLAFFQHITSLIKCANISAQEYVITLLYLKLFIYVTIYHKDIMGYRYISLNLYTIAKSTTFTKVKLPSITIHKMNGNIEVVREFGYEDFKRSLS